MLGKVKKTIAKTGYATSSDVAEALNVAEDFAQAMLDRLESIGQVYKVTCGACTACPTAQKPGYTTLPRPPVRTCAE
ncbi:FeoC-like transcriptional regulator [Pseudovibrio sp. SPO723]|uniref:FeoC-like transcriptional regulator n=1 Tax=Stappiaceae TaxID=2821832 RepID=UPI0039B3B16F